MTSRFPLRTFFENELVASDESFPTEHLVSHLVEQTVRRAALDAATQRYAVEYPSDGAAKVSWNHCLMVAALTELRPVKLLARN